MVTLSGTLAADAYRRVDELCGVQGLVGVVTEGFLYAITNGLTFRYGDETTPPTAALGSPIGAAGGVGVGPVKQDLAGWRIDRLWVRNSTAGSNASVVVNAQLKLLDGRVV